MSQFFKTVTAAACSLGRSIKARPRFSRTNTMKALTLVAAVCVSTVLQAQPAAPMSQAAQREKLSVLSMMDGEWRGTAWYLTPSGGRQELTQTERVGPLLGGAIKVVEGRGYDAQGATQFNAFAVIAVDPQSNALTMRSYADGRVGDFPIEPAADGFSWKIVAGPATISYRATIKDGTWHEVGTRAIGAQPPVTFFEMKLTRLGETSWPGAGAVKIQ
jgi:hypothetical protein